MNAFYEHHKDSIRFGYRCFDRILLNGLIQPFQQPERVVGFFSTYRHLHPVSRDILRGAAEQFQLWVKEQADKWNAPIVEPPRGRRDEFVDPYFRGAGPDQVIVILKAREPARIMTAIGDKKLNRWHLQIADRWIVQYNFYISDQYWGRMFVRMCPYLPFSYAWTPNRKPGAASASFSEFHRLGRAHSRPFLDFSLFGQKTVDFRLHDLNAFLLTGSRCLSVFDKAVDQQILKLHDPGSRSSGVRSPLC